MSEESHVSELPFPQSVVIAYNIQYLCCVFRVLFGVCLNKTLEHKCMIQNTYYVMCLLLVNKHRPLKIVLLIGALKVKGKIIAMYN